MASADRSSHSDNPTEKVELPATLQESSVSRDQFETLASETPTSIQRPFPKVEGYELLSILGQGGMGVVYKARQIGLDRLVALKMIRDGMLAGEDPLRRFATEAKAVASLQHPNVVQIYDIGEHEGHPFFSLELVQGGTLADRFKEKKLSHAEAAKLIETLARAAHHAHEHQIVHRDLKPANVLMTQDDTPKITDFGLAKQLETEVLLTHTASGHLLGTPSYMAPEQAWGKNKEIGPAADIYALGAMLYECLVSRPPFCADSILEVLYQVRTQEPQRPRNIDARCPVDLETICLKCLEREPSKRYATALELAEDLQRFQQGDSILARPANLIERSMKWTRRHPTAMGMVGIVLVAIVLFGIQLFIINPSTATNTFSDVGRSIGGSSPPVKNLPPTKQEESYQNLFIQASRIVTSDPKRAKDLLDQTPEELRGWEWGYLNGLAEGKASRNLRPHDGYIAGLSFDPKSKRFFTAGERGRLMRWSSAKEAPVELTSTDNQRLTGLAYSPTENFLLMPTWKLQEQKLPEKKTQLRFDRALAYRGTHPFAQRLTQADVPAMAWMGPVGGPLQKPIPKGEGNLDRLQFGKRDVIYRIMAGKMPISCVAVSHDGQYFAMAVGHLLPRGTTIAPGSPAPSGGRTSPSPKGFPPAKGDFKKEDASQQPPQAKNLPLWTKEQFVFALKNEDVKQGANQRNVVRPQQAAIEVGEVFIWDANAKAPNAKPIRVKADSTPIWLEFDPQNSERLAVAYENGSYDIVNVKSGNSEFDQKKQLANHGNSPLLTLTWHPKKNQLATGDETGVITIRNCETSEALMILPEHSDAVTCLTYDAQGQRLISGSRDRTLKIWDARTGLSLLTLRGHRAAVTRVAFSPDGQWLISTAADGEVRIWNTEFERAPNLPRGIDQGNQNRRGPSPGPAPAPQP